MKSKSIYDLSWGETSFVSKLQLIREACRKQKAQAQSAKKQDVAGGYSSLSSTYYSVLGTAWAQLKSAFKSGWKAPAVISLWFFTWLPLALWCRWRMEYCSDQVVKLIGYEGMTADQCDIRQSILRRCGKFGEAYECVEAGLMKGNLAAHTESLLRIGLAHLHLQSKDLKAAGEETEKAFACAHEIIGDLQQSSRIYRHCAGLFRKLKDPRADYSAVWAESLAKETGARDQLLKMK